MGHFKLTSHLLLGYSFSLTSILFREGSKETCVQRTDVQLMLLCLFIHNFLISSWFKVWCLFDVYLMFIWFLPDVYQMFIRCLSDFYLMVIWCLSDVYLIFIWCLSYVSLIFVQCLSDVYQMKESSTKHFCGKHKIFVIMNHFLSLE